MSLIDDLIAEHCPGGVEFRDLQEVFITRNGYTPSRSDESLWADGIVPWFRMEDIRANGHVLGESLQHIAPAAVKGGALFPANSILIATSATIGEHALITVPHLSNQRFTSISPRPTFGDRLEMRFVNYYCFLLDDWCRNNTTVSSFASVDMAGFRRFRFPVPPLSVQRAIVDVLDRFTELEANLETELETELEARRRQYQHYRSALLETDGESARQVRLDQVADIVVGYAFKSAEFSADPGDTPLVRGDNIAQGYLRHDAIKRWHRLDDDGLDRYELRTDDVVLAMDRPWIPAGLKWARVAETDLPALLVQRVARLRAQPSVLDQRFLGCVISSGRFTAHVVANQTGNTVPHISGSQIGAFAFPLPDLGEQRQIAAALEAFDAVVSDLSVGLPAELRARRQQYEYYRDKLLTFNEAPA